PTPRAGASGLRAKRPRATTRQPKKSRTTSAPRRANKRAAPKTRAVRPARIKPTSSTSARSSKRRGTRKLSVTATRVNAGRVGLISGGISGTYIRIASDLAAVLNKRDDLRILPIAGQGSVQNITDILYLKGVDVGIVQSDVLAYIRAQKLHRNIDRRIHYITKLYNEEFHLVGGREFSSITDLEGKSVNFGVKGSGTYMTATTVFRQLGIKVRPVSVDQPLALEQIRRGEIAATVFVAGKPTTALSELDPTFGLRLLEVPYAAALQDAYLPATFSAEDYPALVRNGKRVNSIAVGAVMAVYNWPSDTDRHARVSRFVEAFFRSIAEFRKKPRHPKWQEVNLAADLPGWTRFSAAADWLARNPLEGRNRLRVSFGSFLDQTSGDGASGAVRAGADRDVLFQQFLKWRQSQPAAPRRAQ
ncbi:MAG: TAXI family TRAP transporter solute-binding subunit, partial [Pseudomonadota bacterium]